MSFSCYFLQPSNLTTSILLIFSFCSFFCYKNSNIRDQPLIFLEQDCMHGRLPFGLCQLSSFRSVKFACYVASISSQETNGRRELECLCSTPPYWTECIHSSFSFSFSFPNQTAIKFTEKTPQWRQTGLEKGARRKN